MISRHGREGLILPGGILITCLLAVCALTPAELPHAEFGASAEARLARTVSEQEPIGASIDLYEAIARALKYNLDHQVEIAEQAVRERELRVAHFSLLPNIVAGSGYAARDKVNASSSQNALTGAPSLATSTSQDLKLRTADVAFSWNILDFGLSYVRARQAGDKVLIQQELRRKITLRIIEDVRAAYWRAASAQRLLGQLARVEAQARDVEREARALAADKQTSPVTALTYEREVVEVQRTIGELQRELNSAHAQLAALMNVPPGIRFTVVAGERRIRPLPAAGMPQLVSFALSHRPELREVGYRQRINEQEAHAALLEMLPGIQLVAGTNFDSNSFLLHHDWVNWGAKATWNLLKVFSYPARRAVVEEQDEMLKTRALAVTMSIMTQVYVSRIRYAHVVKEHRTVMRYRAVQRDLLAQIRAEATAGRVSRQTLVREELNAVVAEVKLDIAFATVQAAYANMEASLGKEPFSELVAPDAKVREVAELLRRAQDGPVRTASVATPTR